MTQPQDVLNNERGVSASGDALPYRVWPGRYERNIGDVVNNPDTQEWNNTYNGRPAGGTADLGAQVKMIAEQAAWTHTFTDGIRRDPGDILIELMEFAIQWRDANGLPTSAKK